MEISSEILENFQKESYKKCHLFGGTFFMGVPHHFNHHIFFFRATFGYHQCYRNEGVIRNAFRSILIIKDSVIFHKPQKQSSSNSLIPIAKRMVLDDQVKTTIFLGKFNSIPLIFFPFFNVFF